MRLTGRLTVAGRFGLWLAVTEVHDRDALDGHRANARLTVDRDTGVVVNVAAVGAGSWVVGWFPRHPFCRGRHRCGWRLLPGVRLEARPHTAPARTRTPR